VLVYDFPQLAQGKAIPYGTYDVAQDRAVGNVGVTHDTAEFAVESIRRWWRWDGKKAYPAAQKLLICADGGGSNGSRRRAWKANLQRLANTSVFRSRFVIIPPEPANGTRLSIGSSRLSA